MDITSTKKLHNGVMIPRLGFGVFRASVEDTVKSVKWALEAGYRHIDTAKIYGNEAAVGKAVKESGIPRDKIFITTKLWNQDMRDNRQEEAFEQSLKDLGMDYVDLYLIHWPVPNFAESWNILEKLYKEKKIRAIGVSNFQIHHLEELAQTQVVMPVVNQIECHPYLTQQPLIHFCRGMDIAVEAWGPLGGQGADIMEQKTIRDIAEKHERTPAQVILRWHLQHDVIPLPKSVHRERVFSNADLYDFNLDEGDIAAIDAMNQDKRLGADPDNFSF